MRTAYELGNGPVLTKFTSLVLGACCCWRQIIDLYPHHHHDHHSPTLCLPNWCSVPLHTFDFYPGTALRWLLMGRLRAGARKGGEEVLLCSLKEPPLGNLLEVCSVLRETHASTPSHAPAVFLSFQLLTSYRLQPRTTHHPNC